MTYRDEIVDEVRGIREQLCNRAGNLDNLLAILRAEELTHSGRIAKHPNSSVKAHNSRIYGVGAFCKARKGAILLCAEDKTKYGDA
jgi:hypothetical protein